MNEIHQNVVVFLLILSILVHIVKLLVTLLHTDEVLEVLKTVLLCSLHSQFLHVPVPFYVLIINISNDILSL